MSLQLRREFVGWVCSSLVQYGEDETLHMTGILASTQIREDNIEIEILGERCL